MCKRCKFNIKKTLGIVVSACLLLLTFPVNAAIPGIKSPVTGLTAIRDTLPVKKSTDTIRQVPAKTIFSDTLKPQNLKDSIQRVDTLTMSKDSIDVPIKYHADDSGVLIIPNKEFYLYGKAKTDYKELKLEANTIFMDQQSQVVKAYGALDSTGNPLSKPQFTEGELKTVSDTIAYNLKTGKGLTKNTFFQEGEIFMNAKYLKKVSVDEVFARQARFTTCNLDTPHFAFRANRMKIINNKLGITGRVYPEIESVPIPMIFLPFGIFPLNQKVHSGVLLPAFTASEDFGLGLEGLGYYKVFSDYLDLTTRTNLYSYGGWNLNLNSRYIRRYKYTGSISLSLQNTRALNRNINSDQEYNTSKSFMLNWSHSRDNRARPGSNFSANVNFGSTRFNQSLLNNPFQNFQNQLSSSISYSRDWRGKYNMSVNINHNQNSTTRLVNMSLPNVNFNVVTFYPFEPKEKIGSSKWYEKIGFGYNGNFQNQLSFYDTAFNLKRLLDTAQWGAVHSIPITLSLPSLGPITISPSISYEERWYGQRILRSWDNSKLKVDTNIQKGFYTARQMSFGIGINTRIFGTYKFRETSNIKAIRHEIRPSITLNYKPDFAAKDYYTTQVDNTGRSLRFSKYEGGVVGAFPEGSFGGIGFGIDNLLEMKIKDKSDTTGKAPDKKIRLIDGFGFNSSYNLLADSFALGTFSFYARSTLFDKINITAGANLDPYDVNSKGDRLKNILWDPRRFKFGRITSGNLAISTSFRSKSTDGKSEKDKQIPIDPFLTPEEQQRQLQFVRANPAEFTDFNIPWSVTLSYSFNFNRVINPDYSGYTTQTFSSLNFNGDFSLTPKWKLGGTGYYNISSGEINQISMFITREMHCWQLAINVTPVGLYRSFNITISPKSGILRDLRINRSRTFSNY